MLAVWFHTQDRQDLANGDTTAQLNGQKAEVFQYGADEAEAALDPLISQGPSPKGVY